ncbi:MAG TPA: S41 family peptidase [Anaerolineae bacterium]|nr:S41 family peptidase [Anaerolineae bacterium]
MKRIPLCLMLLLLSVACTPRRPPPLSPTELTGRATPTVTPTPLAVALVAPTEALEPTVRVAPDDPGGVETEITARQRRIFEQLWNTINTQYVYPDFGGVDWNAVYAEFSARIDDGLSDEGFWQAMREMIDRLDDDHSTFLTPLEAHEEDAQLQGDLRYTGIGVYAATQLDKRQAVIFSVFPGSPAEEAGLRPHDAILAIEGRQIGDDTDGPDALDVLRGPSGTQIAIRVRSPGQTPREVRVTRRPIDGVLQATGRAFELDAGARVGYLMVPTLWDAAIETSTRQTLTALMAGGPLDSLIIDMRVNGGGVSTNLLALLGFFTSGQHGEFASREGARPLTVAPDPIGNSPDVPLVILISPDTESYAEVFSGVLREAGRARLVGLPTAGNIETIYGYNFEDGSRAWIARETFIPRSGDQWEDVGLTPDVVVAVNWDEFTEVDDPYLAAAVELLATTETATPR